MGGRCTFNHISRTTGRSRLCLFTLYLISGNPWRCNQPGAVRQRFVAVVRSFQDSFSPESFKHWFFSGDVFVNTDALLLICCWHGLHGWHHWVCECSLLLLAEPFLYFQHIFRFILYFFVLVILHYYFLIKFFLLHLKSNKMKNVCFFYFHIIILFFLFHLIFYLLFFSCWRVVVIEGWSIWSLTPGPGHLYAP